MELVSYNIMKNIVGGGSSTYTSAINAVIKTINSLFSIGQVIGSALRRTKEGSYCSV